MTKPQFKHHDSSHTFLGQAEECDVYSYQEDGENYLVARRHQHPTKGFRLLPLCYAVVMAGRGSEFWGSVLNLADSVVANDNLDNPDDLIVVRTHLRRRPRKRTGVVPTPTSRPTSRQWLNRTLRNALDGSISDSQREWRRMEANAK